MPRPLRNEVEARKFERRVAADLGGKRIFLSGAGFEKADVRRPATYETFLGHVSRTDGLAFRVEAKWTQRDHYAFKQQDWVDLIRSAARAGEQPVFAVWFHHLGEGLVIVRCELAHLLALTMNPVLLPFNKSLTLRPGMNVELGTRIPRFDLPEHLRVCAYAHFIQRVKNHAPHPT